MSKRVTDKELDEVERLNREATPEPWEHTNYGPRSVWFEHGRIGHHTHAIGPDTTQVRAEADAAFIAFARTFLPLIARELRALRAPVADVEAEIAAFQAAWTRGSASARDLIRPHVERAAVLAREAEGLRAEVTAAHAVLDKAGALTHMIGVGAPDTTPATLAERIGDVVAEVVGTANDLRAEIERRSPLVDEG